MGCVFYAQNDEREVTGMRGAKPRIWLLVLVCIGAIVAVAWIVMSSDSDSSVAAATEQRDVLDERNASSIRVLDELENVENTIFALDTVWAVTSNLPDNFSAGPTNARLILIDPTTGENKTVLDGLGVQPTFALLDDQVWVKLEDRIVAFDATGSEVASIGWETEGDMIAGDRYLWVADFHGARVIAIDPSTAEVAGSIETDRFPVTPIVAFGHVWIPSVTDGTVTILDEATLGATTTLSVFVTSGRQSEVATVPGGATGDEVWVITVEGELFAIGAEQATLGDLREIVVDRPVNKLVAHGDRVVLLPIGGVSVLVADLASGETLAQIPLDSIPYRAVIVDDDVWITSDGGLEALTQIDVQSLAVVERFQVGTNESNTTGPTQPFVVGDEIWVPNRGDNAIFAVSRSPGS